MGLGGSAGGIEALKGFFQAMPADTGLVIVVVLHLSPEHESTLAEVLARSTLMPVVQAEGRSLPICSRRCIRCCASICAWRSTARPRAGSPRRRWKSRLTWTISLPDGNGWELLRRARLPTRVYCIAMSGFGRTADHLRSREAGYRHHLLKPFDPADLDAMLAEAARELGQNTA